VKAKPRMWYFPFSTRTNFPQWPNKMCGCIICYRSISFPPASKQTNTKCRFFQEKSLQVGKNSFDSVYVRRLMPPDPLSRLLDSNAQLAMVNIVWHWPTSQPSPQFSYPNAVVIGISVPSELNVQALNFKVRHQQGCQTQLLTLRWFNRVAKVSCERKHDLIVLTGDFVRFGQWKKQSQLCHGWPLVRPNPRLSHLNCKSYETPFRGPGLHSTPIHTDLRKILPVQRPFYAGILPQLSSAPFFWRLLCDRLPKARLVLKSIRPM